MRVRLTIDRIEGEFAVVELAGAHMHWPLTALPPDVTEGTCLSAVLSTEQADLTEARARLERLSRRSPQEDDIEL